MSTHHHHYGDPTQVVVCDGDCSNGPRYVLSGVVPLTVLPRCESDDCRFRLFDAAAGTDHTTKETQ